MSGDYRRGTRVNIETDVLAKHLRKLLSAASGGGDSADGAGEDSDGTEDRSGLTFERLRELGF